MKKLFFLAAAVLASFSLFADTEKNPSSATSNSPVEGESYTVPGVYVAGTGGKQAGEMTSKGIKFRLNQQLADESLGFRFDVNEGYTIKKIDFCGHSNNSSSKATISKIVVDGTDLKLAAVELPVNTSSVKFSTGDIVATTAIELYVAEGSYTQANIEFTVTYEAPTKYQVTYKANYGEVADIVENAVSVKNNPFKLPENSYFVGWNTKADGTGAAVAVKTRLTQDTILFAQWKAFAAEAAMEVDSGLVKPAEGVEVALKEGSKGGKMYFVGAKDGKYEDSFIYKKGGSVQLSKGGADSIRVELEDTLKVGSIIRIVLIAADNGKPSLNIISANKTAIPFTSNIDVNEKDTVSVYYVATESDGLAGTTKFIIQRGSNTVIFNAISIEGLVKTVAPTPDPEEEKSKDASISSMKINGKEVAEKEGVFAYEVPAEENLAKVKVEFELAAKATADKESPLEIEVPAAGAAAKEETINVTAEDGVTKKAYTISITKKAADVDPEPEPDPEDQAVENVSDGKRAFKIFENGQLVIIKNGIKYDVTGAVVK